jgi:hypothetical protein
VFVLCPCSYLLCIPSVPRLFRDTKIKKLINLQFSVRMGVWGLTFGFEGTLRGSCRELICEFESPPLLDAAV